MNTFSLLLVILSVTYIFMGYKVLKADKKSLLNRLFFALNVSLVIWSFGSASYISAQDKTACIIWYKIGSVGFYFLVSIIIHFFLLFAKKNTLLKNWWVYIIIYLPGIIFSYMEITVGFYVKEYIKGSNGWIAIAQTDSMWFWAAVAYTVIYICASAFISFRLYRTTIIQNERKQAKVLFITAIASLFAGLAIMVSVAIMKLDIPDIVSISGAIWSVGIFYAIVRYRLLAMTPSLIAENLFQTIIDMVILTDPNGLILTVNPETQRLLGYSQKDLIGESLDRLFLTNTASNNTSVSELLDMCPVRNMETFIISKNGRKIPIILSISECRYNDDKIGYVLVSKDVTEYKLAEEKIQYLATHDSLTGLPNRLMLTQLLDHAIQTAKQHNQKLAVFLIDLDRFKMINDTKGHNAGDLLLQEIGIRYRQILSEADVVSRQGGDEFVILIEDVRELKDLEIAANNILASTYEPVVLMGNECRVTASIGISIYPEDGEDGSMLIKHADIAMYHAKEEGKNNFQFYSKDIHSRSTGRLAIETNLRYALERGELSLHYQAKVDFKTSMITGVEALLRWQNPLLGPVTPTQFIPVAEETGLIIPIGKWVLNTACAQNVAWQEQGLPKVCMSVNLSLRQFTDNDLINDIESALKNSGMEPGLLELEITESIVMSDPLKMMDVLLRIKRIGVQLAIDDFGTGYSSLAQLKHFPIDTLKIDRSFIRNIPDNDKDKAITHAIIAMGETLGLTVVAEGVETIEQMNYLKEQSCDEMQGYYFSRPVEPDKFADLLREHAGSETQRPGSILP